MLYRKLLLQLWLTALEQSAWRYESLCFEQVDESGAVGRHLNFLTRSMGGMSTQTKLSDLNHYQFERLLKLMQHFEGNKPGTVSDWPAPKPGDNASPAPKLNLRKTFSPDLERRRREQSGGGSSDETLERRGEEVFRITADGGERGPFHSP